MGQCVCVAEQKLCTKKYTRVNICQNVMKINKTGVFLSLFNKIRLEYKRVPIDSFQSSGKHFNYFVKCRAETKEITE